MNKREQLNINKKHEAKGVEFIIIANSCAGRPKRSKGFICASIPSVRLIGFVAKVKIDEPKINKTNLAAIRLPFPSSAVHICTFHSLKACIPAAWPSGLYGVDIGIIAVSVID